MRTPRHVLSAFLLVAAGALPLSAEITKGPYLQNPGTTEMTVMWVTDAPGDAVLSYGEKSPDTKITVQPGEAVTHEKAWKDKETLAKSWFYEVRLKGLKPGTTYRYQVEAGQDRSRETFFETVPAQVGKFTFIAYGHSRSYGDQPHVAHQKVAANFDKHKPAFILHSGDLVYEGSRHYEYKTMFFDPLRDVIDHIPLWPVRGNHEYEGAAVCEFARFFSLPGNELYYSFDYGNAHFVMLDDVASPEMLRWCEQDLAASKATWKIAVFNTPAYDLGRNLCGSFRPYLPLFRKYGLDLTLATDMYPYQRFVPLQPMSDLTSKPITHIVTAGGATLNYEVSDTHPYLAAVARVHYFCYMVFTVDGPKLSAEAFDIDGKKIDGFSITQEDGTYDRDYLALVKPEEPIQAEIFVRQWRLRVKRDAVLAKGVPIDIRLEVPEWAPPESIRGDMRITFRVAPDSAADYRLQPEAVETTLKQGQKWIREVPVTLVPLRDVAAITGGRPKPDLLLEISYEFGTYKGKFVAKPTGWIRD